MATVNTNPGAMIALQNLNATSRDLAETQTRINTGLEVASAKDNGAIFAIAQRMRSEVRGYHAVSQGVDRGISLVDVALAAGQSISDILVEMKEKAVAAADTSLSAADRAAFNEDFNALKDQIQTVVDNAVFNGSNIISNGAADLKVFTAPSSGSVMTVQAEDLSLAGATLTITATSSIGTQALASGMIATLDTSINNVNQALARLGTNGKKLEIHSVFVSKLSDTLIGGISNLVDADLAAESAKLQSLQVKQQLGTQALSIANQSPQILLSLFG